MSFFGTNPLSTQIGQLIERASDPTGDDNPELIFEICDVINQKEENAKDALKAIRKKLSLFAGRNWSVVLKLLNITDVCVSNCNKRFHLQIANKDFLQELKNMIGPKLQPPIVVQEKVLYLIQKWSNTFKNDTELKVIENFYNDLRSKGIDFPVAEEAKNLLDTASVRPTIVDTKPNTTITTSSSSSSNNNSTTMIRQNQTSLVNTGSTASSVLPTMTSLIENQQDPRRMPTVSSAITLTSEQLAKLNSELDVVECNVQVFNDVINELTNTQTQNKNLDDYHAEIDLLRELNRTCKDMQSRITQLIGNITNENMINELLRVNDDLNNVFLRHERFERGLPPNLNTILSTNRNNYSSTAESAIATASNNSSKTNNTIPSSTTTITTHNINSSQNNNNRNSKKIEDKPLIDFEDVDLNTNKLNKLTLNSKNADTSEAFLQDENEIKEMENWLKTQGESADNILNKNNQNADFDDFLNQRYNAVSFAGASRTNQTSPTSTTASNNNNNRNIKTDTKSKFEL